VKTPGRQASSTPKVSVFEDDIVPYSTNGVPCSDNQRLTVPNPKPMIQSMSNSDRVLRADATAVTPSKAPFKTKTNDRLSTENTSRLRAALAQQPEIRPEVVERGRALAADPSYPSPEIIRKISAMIVQSPDLSEDNA
jgi:hypothetical protein